MPASLPAPKRRWRKGHVETSVRLLRFRAAPSAPSFCGIRSMIVGSRPRKRPPARERPEGNENCKDCGYLSHFGDRFRSLDERACWNASRHRRHVVRERQSCGALRRRRRFRRGCRSRRVALALQVVCKGAAPSGWAVTNDAWSPTRCGTPTKITYNVWTIVRLDSIPVAGTLSICQGYVRIPSNWVSVSTSWVPTRCGQPTQIINNVATIKRVS
jgi:hypothetical protein